VKLQLFVVAKRDLHLSRRSKFESQRRPVATTTARTREPTEQNRTGEDRRGQERTGEDRRGQERTGEDRRGQEDRRRQEATGGDRTGQDRRGQYRQN
jgi:hypothetical protein